MIATLRVWRTSGQLGAAAIGAAIVVAALIALALVAYRVPVLTIAAAALLYGCFHVATGWTIGPRPACRPGHQTPSRRAVAHAAPRHREPRRSGVCGAAPPHTSVAATLAPTTGRPPTRGSAAHQTPAAVVSPAPAAAGSTPARGHAGSPTVYVPGRATVGGAR